MARQAKAIIDLNAFRHNFSLATSLASPGNVVAVIKANAYGHGAASVARAIPEAAMFAVASIEEAVELRLAGINQPILLLGGCFEENELQEIIDLNLPIVVHNRFQLETLTSARLARPLEAWLKLDSGMHRLGFEQQDFANAYQRLRDAKSVGNIVLMSHFACADNPENDANRVQLAAIEQSFAALNDKISICNSAALITQLCKEDQWARPGIMLYGSNPLTTDHPTVAQLRPVMTLKSKLMAIRDIEPGEAVGYGHTWKAPRPSRIGTIAIGYADGYPRHAPTGTPVLVNGHRAPLVGRVSMDMITVDLTDLPQAALNDTAVLWGEGLSVDEIAAKAGTIGYELLSGVAPRVPREYLLPDKP